MVVTTRIARNRYPPARKRAAGLRSPLLAGAALICASGAEAQTTENQVFQFNVPPGSAAEVVSAITDTTGDPILFPYERLTGLQSAGVAGDYTVAGALAAALAGTDLVAQTTDFGVLTIVTPADTAAQTIPVVEPQPEPMPARALLPAPPRDRVVVTGTRITRSGMNTPTPVTTVSREEIRQLSPGILIDAIDQLPQFVNNSTPRQTVGWTGSAGQSFLNLRGIGSNRTLVLIDGRRMVASTRIGATDIGLLPESLIDRVEIITGGASAAYGSDAVAGVVNFILNKDMQGFSGHAQTGISDRGDDRQYEISLAGGIKIGDRTHLLISADRYENDGVPNYFKREWHQSWATIRNPDPDGPILLTRPGVVSSAYTYGGLIPRGPLAGLHFLPDGQAVPFDYGTNTTPSVQIGGDGVDVGRERTLSPELSRHTAFAYLSHEMTPNMTAYAQALYGRTDTEFDKDPSYMQGQWEATIYIDNPWLPENLREMMVDAGVESFPFSRYASKRDLSVGRVNTVNTTLSLTAGLSGAIGGWRLNTYYQYGQNRQNLELRDTVRTDRVYQAMDAVRDPVTGNIVCRSTLSFPDNDCVPTSFFGDGAVSEEAKAWMLDSNTQTQFLRQHIAEITIDGALLRAPAGPVMVALGAAARYEDFDQYTAPYTIDMLTPLASEAGYRGLPALYSEDYPLLERAVSNPARGTAAVWEVFGETIVPLMEDLPLARTVDLQLALRFAHYRGSGAIWAGKAGLDWRFSSDLRFRGTVSRDVRGGALAERFDFAHRGVTARDPFLEDSPLYSFGMVDTGNPAVSPERADTFTAGLVFTPRFLPGFALSADYYDIGIRDAIARTGVQTIINECFDGAEDMCELIIRTEDGDISRVINPYLNIDLARTRGFDIEASYTTPLSLLSQHGRLDLRAIAAIYSEASLTPFNRPRQDYAGQVGPGDTSIPDYRLLLSATWLTGGASVNMTAHHVSGGAYNVNYVEGVHIDDNRVEGVWYFNTRLAYGFRAPGGGQTELYLNIVNLFDKAPPIAPFSGGGFYGTFHAPSRYDPIGRRYTAGVSWRF